jgi:glycosyltransferase involved in cell wall biosynthesis
MNPLVSVCIPTYKRPHLLREAVQSCLRQSYLNIEIIISDDSPDDTSERVITQSIKHDKIRYYRNATPLKQAANVNQLFSLAQGEYLILLHDDDLLLPNAIRAMVACLQGNSSITACFGKQQIIDMKGNNIEKKTRVLNQDYYRSSKYAGLQYPAIKSALLGQFPNDGYLVRSSIAREIGYRDIPEVGDICDYDFGLRLGVKSEGFYFLNEFTAAYRITDIAVSTNNNHANLSYDLIRSLILSRSLEKYRTVRLRKYARPAINRWLILNQKELAMDIYFSRIYSWKQKVSVAGIIQILLIFMPNKLVSWALDKKGVLNRSGLT